MVISKGRVRNLLEPCCIIFHVFLIVLGPYCLCYVFEILEMINVQADSSVNVPSLYITVLQYTHCISVKYIVFCYCRTQFFVRLFLTSVKLNLFY